MKPFAWFLVLFGCCVALPAQTPASSLSLAGTVNVPTVKRVLIVSPMLGAGYSQARWLSEGERAGSVEVVRLSPALGEVSLRIYPANQKVEASSPATNLVLTLPGAAASSALPSLVLQDAPFVAVLDLYAQLSQRTVLRHPALRLTPINLRYVATNALEAAQALERTLASNQVSLVPDGEKFVLAVPDASSNQVRLDSIKLASAKPSSDNSEILVRAGEWYMSGVDLLTVAARFYAPLLGREVNEASWMASSVASVVSASHAPIFFLNHTPLTRTELIHAFDIIFA